MAPHDIRVNCVAPGCVETEGFGVYPEEGVKTYWQANPQRHPGDAWDVAEACISPAGIVGEIHHRGGADGGWRAADVGRSLADRPAGMVPLVTTEDWPDALRDTASRFATDRLAPFYMAREKQDAHRPRADARNGRARPDCARSAGAARRPGQSSDTSGLIIEAIAYGDPNIGYVQLLSSLCGQIIARHAMPELAGIGCRASFAGETLFALGADRTARRIGCRQSRAIGAAQQCGLSCSRARKLRSASPIQADAVLVFARTGKPEDGAHGISAFLVPMDAPGIATSRLNDLGSNVGRPRLDFLRRRGGAEREHARGRKQRLRAGDAGVRLQPRADRAAMLGPAQASLDETWAYVTERQAFGAPLSRNQGVTSRSPSAKA